MSFDVVRARMDHQAHVDAHRAFLWQQPRPIRNPMPPMTLFPRVERLEAAAHTWSRRVRAAIDCLTGRMDLTLGYDDDGWD